MQAKLQTPPPSKAEDSNKIDNSLGGSTNSKTISKQPKFNEQQDIDTYRPSFQADIFSNNNSQLQTKKSKLNFIFWGNVKPYWINSTTKTPRIIISSTFTRSLILNLIIIGFICIVIPILIECMMERGKSSTIMVYRFLTNIDRSLVQQNSFSGSEIKMSKQIKLPKIHFLNIYSIIWTIYQLIFLLILLFGNPGYGNSLIEGQQSRQIWDISSKKGNFEQYSKCSICRSLVNNNIFHCDRCNICCEGFSHHCEWVGKCIGYRIFLWLCTGYINIDRSYYDIEFTALVNNEVKFYDLIDIMILIQGIQFKIRQFVIIYYVNMLDNKGEMSFDMVSFSICKNCIRFIFILLVEIYVIYLYGLEIFRIENSNYDKLDISIFCISLCSLIIDLFSALFFGIGISQISLLIKILWSLNLYLIFLRFIFRRENTAKYFIIFTLVILTYYLISIIFYRIIPIRYTLLIIYMGIIVCGFHQLILINQLLNHEKSRQIELKQSNRNIKKQNEIQLLDNRIQYERRVISSQVKYHLYLRRHFCIVIIITLIITYFLIWNLEESRNSIGELLVIIIIEVLPSMEYYFFACANHWIINQITKRQQQNQQLQNEIEMM